jgi:hypothetical protein
MCSFESSKTKRTGDTLVAREMADVYVSETDSFVTKECVLTFKFRKAGAQQVVDLTNNDPSYDGACSYFCGANMSLEISGAIKQAK